MIGHQSAGQDASAGTGSAKESSAHAAPAGPLRGEIPAGLAVLWGVTSVACVLAAWFIATAGDAETRWISPAMLPSPAETLRELPRVFGERKLLANTVRTLSRVCLGFGLTAAIGVPLGVLAACFPAVRAFLAPLTVFGRNIPVAVRYRSPSSCSASASSKR